MAAFNRNSAFTICSSLMEIEMPKVTEIDKYAFEGCSSLTKIELPLVTTIGKVAFAGCNSLSSIEIPKVTDIGESLRRLQQSDGDRNSR